jgi:dTDP-4-amino-4,6-dideoxygalactose transaminase
LVAEDLPEGICPLGLPVLLEDRDSAVKLLEQNGISTAPWWSGYHRDMSWDGCADACYLKDHLIMLPVHQALENEDISYIAGQFAKIVTSDLRP